MVSVHPSVCRAPLLRFKGLSCVRDPAACLSILILRIKNRVIVISRFFFIVGLNMQQSFNLERRSGVSTKCELCELIRVWLASTFKPLFLWFQLEQEQHWSAFGLNRSAMIAKPGRPCWLSVRIFGAAFFSGCGGRRTLRRRRLYSGRQKGRRKHRFQKKR